MVPVFKLSTQVTRTTRGGVLETIRTAIADGHRAVADRDFMSMGGAAYAATTLVQTRDIANGAVTNSKLAAGAVSAGKLSKGLLNTISGPQGDTGPAGPAGPAGASVTFTRHVAETTFLANSGPGDLEAFCQNGTDTPVAGGYVINPTSNTDFTITESVPVSTAIPGTSQLSAGWRVIIVPGSTLADLTVYVVCAS
jgi:hypothetical protein